MRDQRQALASNPKDQPARTSLGSLLRSLTTSLRALQDWPALEQAARELGELPDHRELTGRAARELLRCAEAVPGRAAALRAEALPLLERAVRAGLVVDPKDALYAPLRDDPRFRALLPTDRPR